MTNEIKYTLGFWSFSGARFAQVIIFLCCVLLLPGKLHAQEQTQEHEFQLNQTLNQLLGEQPAARYKKILSPQTPISWEVHLPDNDSDEIPGVFVYVSPVDTGKIDPRWRSVMDQQNLIYISANDSGNRVPTKRRMVLATMGLRALEQQYSFSAARINVSGFSGGGRVASKLASQYPEVFTGSLYICGVDFWKKDQTPKVERLLQNRFVFLTGSRDFNLTETRRVHRRYINAGAQHSKLMVIPQMAHEHPDAAALNEAIQFLNDRMSQQSG